MADVDVITLRFTIESQYPRLFWCWAATAKSVYSFYFPNSHTWSQCKIAKKVRHSRLCCTDPLSCDVADELDKALTITENFVRKLTGTIVREAIVNELKNTGRIICARIGWNGGSGHFVAIYGVVRNGNIIKLRIGDPLYGSVVQTIVTFNRNYLGLHGSWSDTYFTDKTMPPGAG